MFKNRGFFPSKSEDIGNTRQRVMAGYQNEI